MKKAGGLVYTLSAYADFAQSFSIADLFFFSINDSYMTRDTDDYRCGSSDKYDLRNCVGDTRISSLNIRLKYGMLL